MFTKALLIGSLLAGAGAAQADLLYSQPWNGAKDLYSSQNDPQTYGHFSTAYDDFTLASASTLTGFDVVGGFFNGFTAPIYGYTLSLYADAGGAPGAVIASSAHDATVTYLGNSDYVPHYKYSFTFLPYAIAPGTYWLSVVADVYFPPEWGLAVSAAGNGNAVADFMGTRTQYIGTNLAFDVQGTGAAPVPEPAGWALLLAGGVGLGVARRWRSAFSLPSSRWP